MPKKIFLFLFLIFIQGSAFASISQDDIGSARAIPIQHNGRVKPLDAFSRQTCRLVCNSGRFGKTEAIVQILNIISNPQKAMESRWIRVDLIDIKNHLGLDKSAHYFSYNEIKPHEGRILALLKSAKVKRDQDIRPSKLEQKAEQLYSQLRTVENLISGESLCVLPPNDGSHDWTSPSSSPTAAISVEFKKILSAYSQNQGAEFSALSAAWRQKTIQNLAGSEALRWRLTLEILYYRYQPFEIAFVLYLLSFILISAGRAGLKPFGVFFMIASIIFHSVGIATRVYVLERAPVSNMYESMIFMNWALMIYACVFSLIRKNWLALKTGACVSAMIMLYANLLPIDPSLEVLMPVLRSNYWLSIHVMTIVSSYGAFGLAMALGHRHLFLHVTGKLSQDAARESSILIGRVIQLGVILIGTGTFLGGVWANESWGRFWGWDPKETWALITFLGYLIIVHLRFLKRLSDFGLALGSVLGFLLVLMTWYGVNFVLGRGLHSYGAGSGGMHWVIYYLIFEALFLGWIIFLSKRRFS